jgi:hypothetical protein
MPPVLCAHPLAGFVSVQAQHADIEQNDLGPELIGSLQRCDAIVGDSRFVTKYVY